MRMNSFPYLYKDFFVSLLAVAVEIIQRPCAEDNDLHRHRWAISTQVNEITAHRMTGLWGHIPPDSDLAFYCLSKTMIDRIEGSRTRWVFGSTNAVSAVQVSSRRRAKLHKNSNLIACTPKCKEQEREKKNNELINTEGTDGHVSRGSFI